MIDRLRSAFDWTFRDRRTGRIVVAQLPNPPLLVFIAASVSARVLGLEGAAASVVRVAATGALLVWAVDEVLRGVNPFRRALGAVVAIVTVVGIAASA